jgi:hypothetical protein
VDTEAATPVVDPRPRHRAASGSMLRLTEGTRATITGHRRPYGLTKSSTAISPSNTVVDRRPRSGHHRHTRGTTCILATATPTTAGRASTPDGQLQAAAAAGVTDRRARAASSSRAIAATTVSPTGRLTGRCLYHQIAVGRSVGRHRPLIGRCRRKWNAARRHSTHRRSTAALRPRASTARRRAIMKLLEATHLPGAKVPAPALAPAL